MFDASAHGRKPGDMQRVMIVKLGSTMPELRARRGDYDDWIRAGLDGLPSVDVCRVVEGEALPSPSTLRAVVVTGSSAFVTDRAPWSVTTGAWLKELIGVGTPLLGICYGHQLLAEVLGGEVGMNPAGREIGMVEVELNDAGAADPLLAGLPRTIRVSSSHRQSVLRLPEGARRLASNAATRDQAYAIGERVWGVQFHPEWDHDVISAYLEARFDTLEAEGLDVGALLARAQPSPHGLAILNRFAELV